MITRRPLCEGASYPVKWAGPNKSCDEHQTSRSGLHRRGSRQPQVEGRGTSRRSENLATRRCEDLGTPTDERRGSGNDQRCAQRPEHDTGTRRARVSSRRRRTPPDPVQQRDCVARTESSGRDGCVTNSTAPTPWRHRNDDETTRRGRSPTARSATGSEPTAPDSEHREGRAPRRGRRRSEAGREGRVSDPLVIAISMPFGCLLVVSAAWLVLSASLVGFVGLRLAALGLSPMPGRLARARRG